MNQRVLIGVVIAVVIIGGAAFWYWQSRNAVPPTGEPTPAPLAQEEPKGLGAQIFEQTENPTKGEFPEANPFSVDTNPFDANTNPYKDEYKNPFR